MAPVQQASEILARFVSNCNNFDRFGNCYNNSAWNRWGRWVALVCIVIFAFLVFFAFTCMTARRRRRRGMAPRYGTGWLGGKPLNGQNGAGYYNGGQQQGYQSNPAPPYSPPVNQQYTGNTFNSNEGYYGQQSGVELQPPQGSYQPQRGGDPVYAAPQGPPPGKGGFRNDGIIR